MPHLGHAELVSVVVTVDIGMCSVVEGKTKKAKKIARVEVSKQASVSANYRLTFAGLHALKPAMTRISVVDISTVLIPRATISATTHSSRFLENAAVGTCYHR